MLINKPKTSNPASSLTSPEPFSGEITLEVFLRDYWQKKPLLIRNAFPNLVSPLSPEDLAGLSCEDDVNARIVIEKGGSRPWEVMYGPFDDNSFEQLPETHWTLLVNDVEKYTSEAKQLFDQFRFIPDWRKDDLMISYAVDGGSVGPHLDAYDVFLIQTHGQRNWKISHQHCNRFIEDIELKILSEFEEDEDWLLDPGDMLYLPPNLAHYGIAKGECMTASIGFRAPSSRAMISEFAEFIASQTSESLRYSDPDIQQQTHPAEITSDALNAIKNQLGEQFVINDAQLKQWFGEFMTDARSSNQLSELQQNVTDFKTLKEILTEKDTIEHSSFSRFLYTKGEDSALLFVDGQSYTTCLKFAQALCQNQSINTADIIETIAGKDDEYALLDLYNRACLN